GGAVERFGVVPDMVTMAKSLGGGLPTGAIGGTEEVMEVVENGAVYQVGTYNGNPLGMAAARASLTEGLTPEAYAHLDRLNDRILAGCTGVIEKYGLPGYAIGVGSKGCVTFSPQKIVDYETFKETQDAELADLAWLFNMNRGIFMTPGREEEWTLSVTHTEESVDRYVAVFEEMASDLPSEGVGAACGGRVCHHGAPVLALAAALAALQAVTPCQDPALALRCPDLVMAAPSPLRVDRKRNGRVFLRMENRIINRGAGPAELFAQRTGPKEMAADQVITDAAGGRHRFV